jgi:plastocyanin
VKRLRWFVVGSVAWSALGPAGAARAGAGVEGRVELPPPSPPPVTRPRYPVNATYTVGPPDPPAAVVFLEGTFALPVSASASPAVEMAQRNYQFAPGLLPIRRGTVLTFPNLDDEYHSVFSYSKAKRFDLGRYQRGEVPAALRFDEPGVVKLYCEIHDHMRGTILVLDTPYFRKTDTTGAYRIEGLPAGSFTLKAWVDDHDVREQAVELRDGAVLRVDFPVSPGSR